MFNKMNFLDLPYEILFTILIEVQDLVLLKNYNKKLNMIIDKIFSYFLHKFSQIDNEWKIYPKILIKQIIKKQDLESLKFFFNNYEKLTDYDTRNYALKLSSKYCNLETVKFMVDFCYINYEYIAHYAVKNKNKEVLDWALNQNICDIDWIAYGAAKGGHVDMLELFMSMGAQNIRLFVSGAAKKGNFEIIKNLLNKIYDCYDWIAYNAAKSGNLELIKLLIEKGARNFYYILTGACLSNNPDIVRYLMNFVVIDMNNIANKSARSGKIEIVKFAIEQGASDFDWIAYHSLTGHYFDIFELAIKHGSNKFKNVWEYAVRNNLKNFRSIITHLYKVQNNEMILYFIDNNILNLKDATKYAIFYNNKFILEWLQEHRCGDYINQFKVIAM